jgi:hypothetical protein
MDFSLNCLLLSKTFFEKIFQVAIPKTIFSDNADISIDNIQVGQFKSHILFVKKNKFSIDDPDNIKL